MMELTQAAKTYEPSGDPEHIAFGSDFIWRCTCGKSSRTITDKRTAQSRAEAHERYCPGETEVDTV